MILFHVALLLIAIFKVDTISIELWNNRIAFIENSLTIWLVLHDNFHQIGSLTRCCYTNIENIEALIIKIELMHPSY